MKTVGVLAVQGAVSEHLEQLRSVGCAGRAVRGVDDLTHLDGLIIPGGESTAISRLVHAAGLEEPIRQFARKKPVLGTCAGLILCATEIDGVDNRVVPLGLMDMCVVRNGFGRQVDSFETVLDVEGIGNDVPAVFIRAPYIEKAGPDVRVLARYGGKIVMAESSNVLVMSFHPELTGDTRILRYFLRKAA